MKRQSWIDVLRGIAICAVVVDHIMYLFDSLRSDVVWRHTFFSVPWFIFLAGVTNTIGAKKWAHASWLTFPVLFWWRRSWVVVAYGVASVISHIILHRGHLQTGELLWQLEWFAAQRTYYFINIILQLYVIFPFLFLLLQRSATSKWLVAGSTILMMAFSGIVLPLWVPPWPFGIANHLFGSLYLAVFWLGMLAGWYGIPKHPALLIIAIDLFILTEWPLNGTAGNFLGLYPTVPFVVWGTSLLILMAVFLQRVGVPRLVERGVSFLGRHSFGIYLYHFLLLELLVGQLPSVPWPVLFGGLLIVALVGPALLVSLFGHMHKQLLGNRDTKGKHAILSATTASAG